MPSLVFFSLLLFTDLALFVFTADTSFKEKIQGTVGQVDLYIVLMVLVLHGQALL